MKDINNNANPTLRDFRALLGNANDGNVVLKEDGTGLEKAGHGNAVTRFLRNYRPMPTGREQKEQNARIRKMLMAAIGNSQEGKALCKEQLAHIRAGLGIGSKNETNELSRVELKIVLDTLDDLVATSPAEKNGQVGKSLGKYEGMVDRQMKLLEQSGVRSVYGTCGQKKISIVDLAVKRAQQGLSTMPALTNVEDMVEFLPEKGVNGQSKAKLAKFVTQNFALVRAHAFDQMVWKQLDDLDKQRADPGKNKAQVNLVKMNGAEVLCETLERMMTDYAKGREPSLKTERLLVKPGDPEEMGFAGPKRAVCDAFTSNLKRRLDLLLPDEKKPSSVNNLQIRNLVACFRKYVQNTYHRVLSQSNDDVDKASKAAEEAVREKVPSFFALSADEMEALAEQGEVFRTTVNKLLGDKLELAQSKDGTLSDDALKKVFDETFSDVANLISLRPLADQYATRRDLVVGERREKAIGNLLEALSGAKGDDLKFVASLRVRLMVAKGKGDVAFNAEVSSIILRDGKFTGLAEEVFKGFGSDKDLLEQRKGLLETLGGDISNSFFKTIKEVEDDVWKWYASKNRDEVEKNLNVHDNLVKLRQQQEEIADTAAKKQFYITNIKPIESKVIDVLKNNFETYKKETRQQFLSATPVA